MSIKKLPKGDVGKMVALVIKMIFFSHSRSTIFETKYHSAIVLMYSRTMYSVYSSLLRDYVMKLDLVGKMSA